jgi:hypothetical protein
MNARAFAHRLGFGRLAYLLWHAPVGVVRRSIDAGGPLEQWRDRQAHAAMTTPPPNSSRKISRWRPVAGDPLPDRREILGPDGALSLLAATPRRPGVARRVSRRRFRDRHDHGSTGPAVSPRPLAPPRRDRRDAGPASAGRAVSRIARALGRLSQYPQTYRRACGSQGWKLVLDSDMLFFRRPDFLLAWLAAPDRPLHMVDVRSPTAIRAHSCSRSPGRRSPRWSTWASPGWPASRSTGNASNAGAAISSRPRAPVTTSSRR